MPYIKSVDRKYVDQINIDNITSKTISSDEYLSSGELNYLITKICMTYLKDNISYEELNKVIGVLECVKQELYRRVVAPYEDKKKEENGDVY